MPRKKYLKTLISSFILLALMLEGSTAYAYTVKTMNNVEPSMLDADYWIKKINNADEIIMTSNEIISFNKEMEAKIPSRVWDLSKLSESYTKSQVQASIGGTNLPTNTFYVNGKQISSTYWKNISKLINSSGVRDENPAKYGFIVKRTNMKIYPTSDILSDDPKDFGFDAFQNSGVIVNEPVQIIHQSSDKKWYYCLTYNCAGWVLASDVAVCTDKQAWLEKLNPKEFLVVTGNKIRIEPDPYDLLTSEMEFSMGTVLELASERELPQKINERALYDNYVVKLPIRNSDGLLDYKLVLIPASRDVNVGFLPYTRANILNQVFKLNGDRYGWGGMLNSRDCSEYVVEVYKSFGLNLPRNTSGQEKVPSKKADLTDLSIESKYKMLDNVAPGSTLHFDGHVMFYIGKSNGRYYVISALGAFSEYDNATGEIKTSRVRGVVVNDLSVKRGSNSSWIEGLTYANQYEKTKFEDLTGYEQKDKVNSLADKFIIFGKDKTHFNPEDKITRAEFSALICRALKLNENPSFAKEFFKDCTKDWYCGYVGTLAKEGYIKGMSQDTFGPDLNISKAAVKIIIGRILEKRNGFDLTTEDGKTTLENITSILSENKNDMSLPCTRYEAAVVISNLLNT